jgi:hypothetical protein
MRLFPAGSAPCLLVAVAVTDILLGAAVLGAAVGARDGTRAGITVASGGGGSGGEVRFRLGETGLVRRDGRPEGSLTVHGGTVASRPPSASWWVTLTVTATATSSGGWDVTPFDFSVRDARGRRYYESGGDLDAATLNPGETVEGTVTFDVPDQHGVVVYAPALGRVLGSWQF